MATDIQILEPLAFFKGLSYDEKEDFAALLNPMAVKEGDVIIRKGTPALTFFIIIKGRFKVSAGEGPSMTIDSTGDIIGWSTVIAPFHYTGTVSALEDGELLYISSRNFFELIQGNNDLGEKIMKKINRVAAHRRAFYSQTT